jgi:hypothetical protein
MTEKTVVVKYQRVLPIFAIAALILLILKFTAYPAISWWLIFGVFVFPIAIIGAFISILFIITLFVLLLVLIFGGKK